MKEKTICDLHDETLNYLDEILAINENNRGSIQQIHRRAAAAKADIALAKEFGRRMEGRMQKYYDAIAGLGFMRTK